MNNSTKPKHSVVYFGTPWFSACVLEALVATEYKPRLVATMPDTKQGRKQILAPPPVKLVAEKHAIPVVQPPTLQPNSIPQGEYDLFIVFAYGHIIPQRILDIPTYGAVNVHASLLPQYRGASPIQSAILNGDATTGITLMLMDEKMDHGAILAQREISLTSNETYTSLVEKMVQQTPLLLQTTLPQWFSGSIQPTPQNHARATYTRTLRTQDGRIRWNTPAQHIERMTRAFNPKPGVFSFWNSKRLKIIQCALTNAQTSSPPGAVCVQNNNLLVACNDAFLSIQQLQLEGEVVKTARQFLQSHGDIRNATLE